MCKITTLPCGLSNFAIARASIWTKSLSNGDILNKLVSFWDVLNSIVPFPVFFFWPFRRKILVSTWDGSMEGMEWGMEATNADEGL